MYTAAILSGVVFIYTVMQAHMEFPVAFALGALAPQMFVAAGILLHGIKFWAWEDAAYALAGTCINIAGIVIQVGAFPCSI